MAGSLALDLSDNNLTGSIPPELGGLAGLRVVYLENNSLTGAIPPELGNLPNLRLLSLLANNLTGSIPSELGNLVSLEVLWLQSNNLTGRIPPELGNLGRPGRAEPRRQQSDRPASLQLPEPHAGGIPIGAITLAYAHATPPRSERGSVGSEDTTRGSIAFPEREVLMVLYHSTGGPAWKRSDNWGTNAPLDDWYGVTPDENGDVAELDLAENGLTGIIPLELGNLPSLEVLNLSANRLTGQLPDTFLDLTLGTFGWDYNPGLCAPDTAAFRAWLDGIGNHYPGRYCAAERDVLMALIRFPRVDRTGRGPTTGERMPRWRTGTASGWTAGAGSAVWNCLSTG